MDQAEICEIHHVVSGEESLNCRNNVNSLVLYDVLKCFLLKYAMDGADKAFPVEYARNRKRNQVNHSLQEKERVVCTNLDNKVLESRKDRLYGTNSRYNSYIDESEMVRVEFLSANGKVTASSSNQCMLQFKSQPIHFVQTILKSAPLIAGFQSESQILNIKMNEFREGIEPTARLKVILEQRAEYKSGAGIPEIYAASLAVESQLPQLKRIIWYWRRTIFVWASFMMFLAELVIV
ncbi:hypothetical protein Patl1_04922 [Pistacia atlantica]|uniref:Uncharacterized protein n=1 Tax=Pistacia atlantica TaxID=434234 RepID=A0ACC1BX06_9ROSI|nr:hypothetical protein Patl1_04922 [Pistacia atlantica]